MIGLIQFTGFQNAYCKRYEQSAHQVLRPQVNKPGLKSEFETNGSPAKLKIMALGQKTTAMKKNQKARNIISWVLQVLLGLQMLMAGQAKFTRPDSWSAQFERYGYPDHFFYVIGGLEVILAIALFIPKLTTYASLALVLIMLGATITLVINGEDFLPPLIVAILQALLAWLRSDKRMNLKRG